MRACQRGSPLRIRTAFLKGIAVVSFLSLGSPVSAGPVLTFPNDFYVQAGGGSQTGDMQLVGPTDPQPLFAQVTGHATLTGANTLGFVRLLLRRVLVNGATAGRYGQELNLFQLFSGSVAEPGAAPP
jgi:hypothetical protein